MLLGYYCQICNKWLIFSVVRLQVMNKVKIIQLFSVVKKGVLISISLLLTIMVIIIIIITTLFVFIWRFHTAFFSDGE